MTHNVAASENPEYLVYGQVAEEVRVCLQAGRRPDVEPFVRDHPELADKIRQLVPTLLMVQQLGEKGEGPAEPAPRPAAGGELPEQLGDFRILRELGRGGMGIVYEAEQISLKRRHVALKVLPFAAVLDPRQLQRFQNEAETAAFLHHTNIVPVYAVGSTSGVYYYAMQLIQGQSLADVIVELISRIAGGPKRAGGGGNQAVTQDKWPSVQAGQSALGGEQSAVATSPVAALSTERSITSRAFFHGAARLAMQAAFALDYAHQQGVLHRDIKPANLLLDARGNLWITDFGLARFQSEGRLSMTGDLIGTLRYMSPEQALAKRVIVDHRSDIYALGVTLYELLTLEPAFAGDDRQELLRKIAFEEPKPARRHNKSVPVELETIVLKAMEKNPADRYDTAQEMGEDLERFLKDESIRARRPPLARRARRWCRRHKTTMTGIVVLVMTAAVLGAAMIWSRHRELTAAEQTVENDLKEAEILQKQEQWGKANEALGHARGLLSVLGSSALAERVNESRRQVAFVAQLAEIRLEAAGPYLPWPLETFPFGDDSSKVHSESVGPHSSAGGDDSTIADQAYAKAFSDRGLDIAARSAEDIARDIRAMPICIQIVAALDNWSYVKSRLPKGDPEPVLAIARLANDDKWRQDLRAARMAGDPKAFDRLAETPDILAQPPVNLLLLSYRLDKERAIELLRRAQDHYPGEIWIHVELAGRLGPESAEALACLRAAVALQPRNANLLVRLGLLLEKQELPARAIAVYRQAIDCEPDAVAAYRLLGHALHGQGDLPEAIRALEKAVERDPNRALAHFDLGMALFRHGEFSSAAERFSRAIDLAPNESAFHDRLGEALEAERKLPDAERAFRKSITVDRTDRYPYRKLGDVLLDQGKPVEAEQAYRKAIELKPDYAKAQFGLANSLKNQGKLSDAVPWFRKAGPGLAQQGLLDKAEQALRTVIASDPNDVQTYFNLSSVLWDEHKWTEAIDVLRSATNRRPKFGPAYCQLGAVLGNQGQYTDSLAALKRGRELGVRLPNTDELIHRVERLLALEAKLPRFLAGEVVPAGGSERIDLAEICRAESHRLYVAAARFYAEAFAADPNLQGNSNCYPAACAAALAGCRHGKGAADLDEKQCARLRNQAHGWFQAVVEHFSRELEADPDKGPGQARYWVHWWQTDPDLGGVRDADALARLPEAEARQWRKLWQDVEELRLRANEKYW